MNTAKMIKMVGMSAAAFFALTVAAPAQTPDLVAIDGLLKGMWTLNTRGSSEDGKQVCLGDPKLLLQIQHGSASCSRYVIENTPNSLRVSYKCGNLGHGVTSIRKETSGLVQIQSQGIQNNAPFSFSLEGRRTGDC